MKQKLKTGWRNGGNNNGKESICLGFANRFCAIIAEYHGISFLFDTKYSNIFSYSNMVYFQQ